jgi:uncharacterized 2Fe-2S/4Fe-4S cluster protein (DUF4445 family)
MPRKNRKRRLVRRTPVSFLPDGQTVSVPDNSTLLEAAQAADVHVNASCNGKGSCGKCKLVVVSGNVETAPTPLLTDGEKAKGYVLACQSRITGDVSVQIPEEVLERNSRSLAWVRRSPTGSRDWSRTSIPCSRKSP